MVYLHLFSLFFFFYTFSHYLYTFTSKHLVEVLQSKGGGLLLSSTFSSSCSPVSIATLASHTSTSNIISDLTSSKEI